MGRYEFLQILVATTNFMQHRDLSAGHRESEMHVLRQDILLHTEHPSCRLSASGLLSVHLGRIQGSDYQRKLVGRLLPAERVRLRATYCSCGDVLARIFNLSVLRGYVDFVVRCSHRLLVLHNLLYSQE